MDIVIDKAITNIFSNPMIPRLSEINVPDTDERKVAGNTQSFDSIFKAALDMVNETSKYQFAAEVAQIDFATGKTDNMLEVLMAQDKAYSTLNFTVQVTNKVIEAYREIMRIQL